MQIAIGGYAIASILPVRLANRMVLQQISLNDSQQSQQQQQQHIFTTTKMTAKNGKSRAIDHVI